MPTFEIFAAYSGRIHRWANFDDYDIVKVSATRWRLDYDEDRAGGPLEPERQPARIDLTIAGGDVTKVTYRDGAGHKLAEMRGTALDKGLFEFLAVDRNQGRETFQTLAGDGLTVIGGQTGNNQFERHDDVTTSYWDDTVRARSGNDYLKDFGGTDTYDGGTGRDTVTYDEWQFFGPSRITRGIVGDLATGRVRGPDGEIDRLVSIESLRGTFLNDTMKGNGQDNYFEGGRGRDVIDGRGGFDVVGVSGLDDDIEAGRRTVVNLKEGFAVDVFGTRDTFTRVEGGQGSAGRDTFIDNNGGNYFGGEGGNDRFVLSGGDDSVRGEDGADVFVFRTLAFGRDRIEDFDGSEGDRIDIIGAARFSDVDVIRDGDDTVIRLNGRSAVILEDYDGAVAPYLLL